MSTIDLPIQPTEAVFEIPEEIPLEELSQKKLREYLYGLKKTVLTAALTIWLSVMVGVPALCALIVFVRSGDSFMHPYLAMFLTLGAIGLLAVSVVSAFKVKNQLQSAMGRLLRVYREMP